MKRIYSILLFLFAFTFSFAFAEDYSDNLLSLPLAELENLQQDIVNAKGRYHSPDHTHKDDVLNATEKLVESHFSKKGIDISWAWVNYSYTREWDFYTLQTHIDYEDGAGKHKPDVYSEVLFEKEEPVVYYLSVGKDVLVDQREDLPQNNWTEQPEVFFNEASGIELSLMSPEELDALFAACENEIVENHTPESRTEEIVLSLAMRAVEEHVGSQTTVSWAWFDYDYTREWDFYTLTTPVDYDTNYDIYVYAEAYPVDNEYMLFYLSLGNEVLLDKRDQLPEDFSPISAISAAVNTPSPTSTPEPTATPEPILLQKGSSGEDVKLVQDALILLGYLDPPSDGKFGNNTKAAVEKFQEAFSMEVTGIVDNDDVDKLLEAVEAVNQLQAQYEAQRQEWIDSQFSIWNGSHNDLEELIKEVLNDEKSYKHIETSYFDIKDEETALLFNETLRKLDNTNRLEVGDLFIIVEFSAKNAFNATIKSTAYGIASYENNTITLVAIE